jgi:hypothetical protein
MEKLKKKNRCDESKERFRGKRVPIHYKEEEVLCKSDEYLLA